ncbi:MAG: TolC family protein, partial [Cyclobacteriaceae bacterium]|nr:TolC family protein [Cyclobacteriaceae bacterium]
QFPPLALPEDFDTWFAGVEESNPILQYLNKQVEISRNEEKLNRAMSLPKFSAGYMSEKVVGEKYQGLSVGMSIPLWENKNTVKAAKAQTVANMAMVNDSHLQLYNMLKNHHRKAVDMPRASEGYSGSLITVNNTDLLKRAYDMGEISLIEYLVGGQFYYETVVKALETRREVHKAAAELEKWN